MRMGGQPTVGAEAARARARRRVRGAGRVRGALDAARRAGRLFGVGELALDEVEAGLPEAGVGEVDADDAAELLGRARTARGEQLEVARHQLVTELLVALVH